jgi:hypothetical protein
MESIVKALHGVIEIVRAVDYFLDSCDELIEEWMGVA